jgi:hypothetical protein
MKAFRFSCHRGRLLSVTVAAGLSMIVQAQAIRFGPIPEAPDEDYCYRMREPEVHVREGIYDGMYHTSCIWDGNECSNLHAYSAELRALDLQIASRYRECMNRARIGKAAADARAAEERRYIKEYGGSISTGYFAPMLKKAGSELTKQITNEIKQYVPEPVAI